MYYLTFCQLSITIGTLQIPTIRHTTIVDHSKPEDLLPMRYPSVCVPLPPSSYTSPRAPELLIYTKGAAHRRLIYDHTTGISFTPAL